MTHSADQQCDLSADTQAVLLLSSALGGSPEPKPLSAGEYNRVTAWLHENHQRPGDLLASDVLAGFPEEIDLPTPDRLRALLERGRLLSLAVTKWADFGIWVVSRADSAYPARLRRLRGWSSPLIFGVGSAAALESGGLAIVGSRDVDEEAREFTRRVGSRCASQDVPVISGGARGIDQEAISSALEAGGKALAVLAESLLKAVTERSARNAIRENQLTVVSPYDPEVGFTVGRAMGRNKYIYALADHTLVVRFKTNDGGTWAGSVERLNYNQADPPGIPVFVRVAGNPEDGLRELQKLGALPLPEEDFLNGEIAEVLNGVATPVLEAIESESASNGDVNAVPVEVPKEEPTPEVEHEAPSETCYNRCLELILRELRAEPTKPKLAAIAKRLGLLPKQFSIWLEQAIAEGKVKVLKKGRVSIYADASLLQEGTLFEQNGQEDA